MHPGTHLRVIAYLLFLVSIPLGEVSFFAEYAWLTVTKSTFLVLLGVLAFSLLRGWRPVFPPLGVVLAAGACTLCAILAAFFSSAPAASVVVAGRIVSVVLLLWITVALSDEPDFILKSLMALLFAGVLCALLGIYQTATGETLAGLGQYGYFGRMIELCQETEYGAATVVRAGATFDHPNVFGTFLIGLLPTALYFAFSHRSRLWRYVYSGVLVLLLVALVYTFSRSAWLGGGMGILVVIALNRSIGFRTAGLLIAIALIVGVVMLPRDAKCVLLNRSGSTQSYDVGRLYSWHTAAKMIASHPVLGVGLGRFHASYSDYAGEGEVYRQNPLHHMDAHNTFLDVGAEGGLLSLAAFTTFLFLVLRLLLRLLSSDRGSVALPLFAGCLAILVQSMLQSLQYEEIWWVLMGLGLCSVHGVPKTKWQT